MLILGLSEIHTSRSSLDNPRIVWAIIGLRAQRSDLRIAQTILGLRFAHNIYIYAINKLPCRLLCLSDVCVYARFRRQTPGLRLHATRIAIVDGPAKMWSCG